MLAANPRGLRSSVSYRRVACNERPLRGIRGRIRARPLAKIRGLPTFWRALASARLRGTAPDRLGSDPVERDMLGRIQRVLKLEAVCVDRQDRRLSPGDN